MEHNFSGEQLRIARIFAGFALQDLAIKIGNVSKQYLQQLEKNVKLPSEDMIEALSEALNVEKGFFYQNSSTFIAEEHYHFRKLASTPLFVKEQALSYGQLLAKFIEYLDDQLNLPIVNFPKYEASTAMEVEKIAEHCRDVWKLGKNTPIKNMVKVLENAGAIVSYFKGVSDKIDAFSFETNRPIIIRNDAKDSICRMRFDLAHECGHIVMHECISTGDTETEAQANRFASSFLLPREAFFNEFSFLALPRIQWSMLVERKKRWKVSLAAIFRRAYELGIIDAIKYRNANISLRKNGWTKIELGDEFIEKEDPILIKKSIEYFEKKEGAMQNCIRELNIKKEFLEKLINMEIDIYSGNIIRLYK